jgi:hypothetical protein
VHPPCPQHPRLHCNKKNHNDINVNKNVSVNSKPKMTGNTRSSGACSTLRQVNVEFLKKKRAEIVVAQLAEKKMAKKAKATMKATAW